MNVKQLRQKYQKSGVIKTGLEDPPKQRRPTVGEISRNFPAELKSIIPDPRPLSFSPSQKQKDFNADDFKKLLSDKLQNKSVNLENVTLKAEQQSIVVNKHEQPDMNLNQIVTKASQSRQSKSSMSVRYGINENYRTRTEEELIFSGLQEQNQLQQSNPITFTIQKVPSGSASADFSKKMQQVAEQQLNNVVVKKELDLSNNSKTKILNRINFVLNFIFEGGEIQNITGKLRQSFSSSKSTSPTKEISDEQSPRKSKPFNEIVHEQRKQTQSKNVFYRKEASPISISKDKEQVPTNDVNEKQSAAPAIKDKCENIVHCQKSDLDLKAKKKPKNFESFDDL